MDEYYKQLKADHEAAASEVAAQEAIASHWAWRAALGTIAVLVLIVIIILIIVAARK